MRQILIILCLGLSISTYGQSTFKETFHSKVLNEDRVIRVHLPESFDKNESKRYNLILALDGEHMFYATIGNTEILSSEEVDVIPEVVVVGVDQNFVVEGNESARWQDCDYNWTSGLPEKKGVKFLSFISTELIPYLEDTYNTNSFITIVGHSLTANYINYFLLQDPMIFQGFIGVSPYVPAALQDTLFKSANGLDVPVFYYMSTGENDLTGHKDNLVSLDSTYLSKSNNPQFHYEFSNYKKEDHMSLVNRSLPEALRFVYSDYSPIDEDELGEIMLKEVDPIEYVNEKYNHINSLYHYEKSIRLNDLFFISFLLESQENWTELKRLGQITVDLYPDDSYGYYMIGKFEENNGELENALEQYELGYARLSEDVTNKDDFYEPITRVKELMNQKE